MKFFTILSGLIFCTSVFATPTLEDYADLPTVAEVAVSPNGKLLAYTKSNAEKESIHIYSLEKNDYVAGLDVSGIEPDALVFLSDDGLFLNSSVESNIPQVRGGPFTGIGRYYSLKTRKARQLIIPGENDVYPLQWRLDRLVGVSEDQDYAYLVAYSGDVTFIFDEFSPPPRSLFKVKLHIPKGRSKAKIQKLGTGDTVDFYIGRGGKILAMEEFDTQHDPNIEVHKLSRVSGKKELEIYSRKENRYEIRGFSGVTPDEKSLVLLKEEQKSQRLNYHQLNLEHGTVSEVLFNRENSDIVGVVKDLQQVVHGIEYSGFAPEYYMFDKKLNERIKAVQAQFPEHVVRLESHSPNWEHIVFLVEGSQTSGDYYLFSKGKKPFHISSKRSKIKPEDINPLGKITYSNREGVKIPALLTIPRNKVSEMKNLPTVIFPHDGPDSFNQVGYNSFAQALASEGYLVVMPQYRGSSGFGVDHERSSYGEWGGKIQDDISDALSYLSGKGIVDPKRVCIAGFGFGGYSALAGGAFTPDLYKCVVSINGISDLQELKAWINPKTTRQDRYWGIRQWRKHVNDEAYPKEKSLMRSPSKHAVNFNAPVLLIHENKNEFSPYKQSKLIEKALKKAGKDVKLVKLKEYKNKKGERKTRLKLFKEAVGFIKRHI